ncbi:metallo-beta-lactamase family protein [Candidatus Regiella insecticola LSR1]|uniref:Metallo-beta-lactamase family protein n=1 Tax=Candidatus Regiella insecticola LSR1 TaxID=663321 RepID=E0WS47_9ENTR|nr:MBL fold metallo-hydrolase [Candidatus Regiella insecticola]EFL92181.1 metallo-beta-lactamase family protein [Candidatus Regiella insecticola LSR1]
MAQITTFEVGYCSHPGCMVLRGAGFGIRKFLARAYFLAVGNRYWLWDTGYADHFIEQTKYGIFQIYRKMTPVHFNRQESLINQLTVLGIAEKEFNGLIISHFHGDHIAGLRDFNQLPVICSGEGWQQTRHLRGMAALRRAFIPGLIPENFESRLQFIEAFPKTRLPAVLAPFEQGYLLPDSAREIILVPLPGHAAGHIGAFILTEQGWTLLASDAAWTPLNYQEMRGPSRMTNLLMDNPGDYYQTLKRLNQLYLNGNVDIRLCHEGAL